VQFEYAKAEGLGRTVLPWLLDETPLPAMLDIQGIGTTDTEAVAATVAHTIGWGLTRRRWLAAGVGTGAGVGSLLLWAAGTRWGPKVIVLAGTVVDMDQNPLAGVEVSAQNTRTQSSAEGRFSLRLPDEKKDWVQVRFSKSGYRTESTNAPVGESFQMTLVKLK
jgi:hypothetical protein